MFLIGIVVIGILAFLVALLQPGLIESRQHGNEAHAIAALRNVIRSAQEVHKGRKGRYGTIDELIKEGLLDPEFSRGRLGYAFRLEVSSTAPTTSWSAAADPAVPGKSGFRYFATSTTEPVVFYTTSGPVPLADDGATLPAGLLMTGK